MASTPELVLVTGATGFIGFRTLVETVKAGYRARAAVRNQGGVEKIKAAKSIQPYLDQVEFVLVPDIIKFGAYDEAVAGVDYIIHLASPTTNLPEAPTEETYDAVLIQPALQGTMNMLRAAKAHSPSLKRMVITASIVSIIEWPEMYMHTGTVFNEKSRTKFVSGPYGNSFAAYGASKVAALNATEEWVETEKPHFDINHIAPSFTIGVEELATTRMASIAGTNNAAIGHLIGKNGGPTPSTGVSVFDIAKMHVLALSPRVPGNQLFIGVSENSNLQWEDSFEIVKKHFPEAVPSVFPLTGSNPTNKLIFDNSYTKKTLGIEFISYEEQVKSIAAQYIALKEEGKAGTA
jgi:nucleoside-diphosphate-sugar epimerase